MISQIEKTIALRYLKPRRNDGFLRIIKFFSFTGIALGVAILIIVMSVMNGFRAELVEKILGFSPHITIKPYDQKIELNKINELEKITEKLYNITKLNHIKSFHRAQQVCGEASIGVDIFCQTWSLYALCALVTNQFDTYKKLNFIEYNNKLLKKWMLTIMTYNDFPKNFYIEGFDQYYSYINDDRIYVVEKINPLQNTNLRNIIQKI